MDEYEVVIPVEVFAILEWQDEGLPAICVVNQALAKFEPKGIFAWHLSIIVDCEGLAENGMPSRDEVKVLDELGELFDKNLKADGNALFLCRISWNATRQFLYRVYDPEVANASLTEIIDSGDHLREFEFRMEFDENWEYARYYLNRWEN